MPMGKNGEPPSSIAGQDRPVIFQKHFKSGGRSYAVQIKLAINGRKYLALTETVKDPDTQEIKKHYIRVNDQDMKEFFSMLQETVVYLRTAKTAGNSVAGVVAGKPKAAAKVPSAGCAQPAAPPARATAAPVKPARPIAKPQAATKRAITVSAKPPIIQVKPAKAGYRPAPSRSR